MFPPELQKEHIKDTFNFSDGITQIEQNELLTEEEKRQKKAKVRLHLENTLSEFSSSGYFATGTDVISSANNPKELACIQKCANDAITEKLETNGEQNNTKVGCTDKFLESKISSFDVYQTICFAWQNLDWES